MREASTISPVQRSGADVAAGAAWFMSNVQLLPLLVIGFAFVALALPQVARAYKRHRRLHLVRCPASHGEALVQLGRAPAEGARTCPVTDCTEWPKRRGCSQECSYALPDAHPGAPPGTLGNPHHGARST